MAAEVSTKQMSLTRNAGFMERVQAMMARVAGTVLNEPASTAHHLERAAYSQKVTQSPAQMTTQAGPQIVMGVNVIAATVYDETFQVSTCTIADIDLESQVTTLWNSLGGIDTAV